MTISTLTSRVTYPGAGSPGPFAIPFRFLANADLRVTRRSVAGVETTLVLVTNYSLTGAGELTGTLTLVTALAAGETLTIRRDPPLTQSTSIRNQGTYFPATIEDGFDRLVMQQQAQHDELRRALRLSETFDPAAFDMVIRDLTAGKVLVGTGTGFTMATLDAGAIALPGEGRTVPSLTSYLFNNRFFNVKDWGALGNGVADEVTALRLARSKQVLALLSGTGGIYGAGANVGTSPPLVFPFGVYKVTDYITNDVNEEVRHSTVQGERAIIVASAGVRVFGGVAYNSNFKGLVFRQGACAISIKSNQINSSIISIDECEFHQQTDACIETDSTSNAGLILISRSKFMQTVAASGHFMFLGTGDIVVLDRCWLEGEPVCGFDVTGVLILRDCLGAPDGALATTGGRWVDLRTISSQLYVHNFRYGGESGGGCFVRNYADMDITGDIEATVISIKDSQCYAAAVYALEFYKLPNVIEFTDNYGLVGCLGLYFDAGLTNADFRNFQEFGRVSIKDNYATAGMPIELDGNRTANGDLGIKVFTAMRAKDGDFPIPLADRLKVSEIRGSGDVSGGGFASVANSNTTDALVDDGYLVSRREITATADEASRSYNHTTFLDPAVLTYGRTYTLNLVVDVNAEFSVVTLSLCGATKRFPVARGRHVLSLPFVYLNNTAAPGVSFDAILETVDLRLSGDVVYLGRHILVEGIQRTKDVLVIEGTAAPAAYTDGIGPNVGYFRGDVNYRTNVAAAGAPGDVCVTEGAPGTWKAMAAVAA